MPSSEREAAGAPRVLHLRSSCGFYGAEGVIDNLVRAYRGEAITVCLADAREPHTELVDRLARDGYPTATIPSKGALDPAVLARFDALVRQYNPDVIHAHEYKSDAIAFAVTRRLPFRPSAKPMVATMHGLVETTSALRRYERLDGKILRRFQAVVPVSRGTEKVARRYGVAESRIHRIPNGVDTNLFQPSADRASARAALGIPPDGVLAGVVGRLSEEKGQAVLLEALAAMGTAGRDMRVAFVGDGPLGPDLEARAAALGLEDRVHFLGRREDMPRVYGAFDILALPSLTEGLPLTVLEAAASGVPVVASDVGDVAVAVPDGVGGLLVPPGDAGALASALSRMWDPALRARLSASAREGVRERFSTHAMARAYEDVYRAVCGWKPASSAELEAVR